MMRRNWKAKLLSHSVEEKGGEPNIADCSYRKERGYHVKQFIKIAGDASMRQLQ